MNFCIWLFLVWGYGNTNKAPINICEQILQGLKFSLLGINHQEFN